MADALLAGEGGGARGGSWSRHRSGSGEGSLSTMGGVEGEESPPVQVVSESPSPSPEAEVEVESRRKRGRSIGGGGGGGGGASSLATVEVEDILNPDGGGGTLTNSWLKREFEECFGLNWFLPAAKPSGHRMVRVVVVFVVTTLRS